MPYIIAAACTIVVIVLDQLSKVVVYNEIGPGGTRRIVDVLPGLKFVFVRNTGSAFGLFQGQSSALTILTFVAIGFLAIYFIRNARNDALLAIGLGLMLGGAVGNLIDRIRYDYVIDFIRVPRWPTFNIADSAITVGVIILLYTILLRDIRNDLNSPAEATDEPDRIPKAASEDS